MTEEIGQLMQLGLIWMVFYGLLAFGWVQLRDVYRVEGGRVFGAMFYSYTVVGALGLIYIMARIGLPAIGVDPAFLRPVEALVGSATTIMQLVGVLAVVTGIILYIARFVQSRRHPGPRPLEDDSPNRPSRRKTGRA